MSRSPDVVVIGAGIVGAAVACFAARAGLRVVVLDRGPIASGTSSRCEGNLLLSDKEVGPELELARYSQSVWREDLAEHAEKWEFQAKGGLVVATSDASAATLRALAEHQRGLGIEVDDVADSAALRTYEPALSPALVAGAFYPQDAQVQPVLAAHHLLALARADGAEVRPHHPVDEILVRGGRAIGVRTRGEVVPAGAVINCAGPWSGEVAASAGVHLPVLPRRGFVLVTEPLPVTVHHKVYAAEYVGDVASGDAGLQVSPVVEGTPSGTVLIGASRERVGFDESWALEPVTRLASAAIALFPALAGANVLRTYTGFRPYCPDHLPAIGEDDRLPGLWHATGHEGAGVGLSVGTAKLLVQALRGQTPDLDLAPFRPARLDLVAAA
ncbi:NAD(P)/FAD-dependent oxidoreductase [Microbacterium trichothecenolyticum]|uniref:Glycine/D-amino acid oxidase-like deaminating enzyme n=1 Tax=Microbacterium trichothecenolyticum TaxID=69370 RepID=A0ABU0TS72_MICTR|nr:FAD-dependent oxidoreductase [Microbacterium trichothecenolyticum]MDQ1122510.1 glycine/D-amino acid oxidase-like deaminating enzyme [Microbacterium trichothecenolyticum]